MGALSLDYIPRLPQATTLRITALNGKSFNEKLLKSCPNIEKFEVVGYFTDSQALEIDFKRNPTIKFVGIRDVNNSFAVGLIQFKNLSSHKADLTLMIPPNVSPDLIAQIL